jgi:hypothetical protein
MCLNKTSNLGENHEDYQADRNKNPKYTLAIMCCAAGIGFFLITKRLRLLAFKETNPDRGLSLDITSTVGLCLGCFFFYHGLRLACVL